MTTAVVLPIGQRIGERASERAGEAVGTGLEKVTCHGSTVRGHVRRRTSS
jgi:hypothetical protein